MNNLKLFAPKPRVILDYHHANWDQPHDNWQVTYLYRHTTQYNIRINAQSLMNGTSARKFKAELKRTIYAALAHNIYDFAGQIINSDTDPATGAITKPAYDLLVVNLQALVGSIPAFPLWHPEYNPLPELDNTPIIPDPQIIETNPIQDDNTMGLQVSFTWRLDGGAIDLTQLEQRITDNRAIFQAHIYSPVRARLLPIIHRFTRPTPFTDLERQEIHHQLIAISNNPLGEELP